MEPARISGHRLRRAVVLRRFFIVGGGLVALVLMVSPRWEAAQRRRGIYSDTYSSIY